MVIESSEDVAEIIKNDFTNPIFPDISIYDTQELLNVFGTDDFPENHIPDDWSGDELPEYTSFEHFLRKIETEKWESTMDVLERLYAYINPEEEQDILGLSDEEVEAMQETDIVRHVFDFFDQIGIGHAGELPELNEELIWEEELVSIGAIELKEFIDSASLQERIAYIFTDDVIHKARELIDEDYERYEMPDLTMENADAIRQEIEDEEEEEIEDEEEEEIEDGEGEEIEDEEEEEIGDGEDNYSIVKTYPDDDHLEEYFEDLNEALAEYDNILETDNNLLEIEIIGPNGDTIHHDTNKVNIYAVTMHDEEGHKLIFASMDPAAGRPIWWEGDIEVHEDIDEDDHWYIEVFQNIPADVAHDLVKHGTEDQVYTDDYAAYNEAVNQSEVDEDEEEEYTVMVDIDSDIESPAEISERSMNVRQVTGSPDPHPPDLRKWVTTPDQRDVSPELLLTEEQLDAYAQFYSLAKRMDRSVYECDAPCLGLLELDAVVLTCTRCGKVYDEEETANRIYGHEQYRIDTDDIKDATVNFIKIKTGGSKVAPKKIDIDDVDIEIETYDENDPEDNEDTFVTEELVNIPSRIWSSSPSMQTILSSIPSRSERLALIDSVFFHMGFDNKLIFFKSERTEMYESIIDTLFVDVDAADMDSHMRAIGEIHLFFEYCALFDAGFIESDVDPFRFLKALYTRSNGEFRVYLKEHNIDIIRIRTNILAQILDKDDKFDMAGYVVTDPSTSLFEFSASLPIIKRYYNYLISKLEGKKYSGKTDWTNELIPKANIKLREELEPVSTTRLFGVGQPIITITEPPETFGTSGRIEGYQDGMIKARINRTPINMTHGRRYDNVSIPREYIAEITPPNSINIGLNMIDIFMDDLVQKYTYPGEESDEHAEEETYIIHLYTYYNDTKHTTQVNNFKSKEDREKFIDLIPDHIPDFYTEDILIRKMDNFDLGGLVTLKFKNGVWVKEEGSNNYDEIIEDLKQDYDADSIPEYFKRVVDEWGMENNVNTKCQFYEELADLRNSWFIGIRTPQGKAEAVGTFDSLAYVTDAYFDLIDTQDSHMMMKILNISKFYMCANTMAYSISGEWHLREMQEILYGESELMDGDKIFIKYGIDDIKTFAECESLSDAITKLNSILYKMANSEENFRPTDIHIQYDTFPAKVTIMKEQIRDFEFRTDTSTQFDHRIVHYLDRPLDMQNIDMYIAAVKDIHDDNREVVEYVKFKNDSTSKTSISHILPANAPIMAPQKLNFINIIETRYEFANELSRHETTKDIDYEEELNILEDDGYEIIEKYNSEEEE